MKYLGCIESEHATWDFYHMQRGEKFPQTDLKADYRGYYRFTDREWIYIGAKKSQLRNEVQETYRTAQAGSDLPIYDSTPDFLGVDN